MKIQVNHRNGSKLEEIVLEKDQATVLDLKKAFYQRRKKYYPDRSRFVTTTNVTLYEDTKSLKDYGIKDGDALIFKDLGPQISYKLVFILEYLGPLLIYPLFYLRPSFIYGSTNVPYHHVQNVAFLCWTLHYVKRELETLFVHRFSHGTMPFFNLFKNSSYYWGMCALVAYFVNHPQYTPPKDLNFYAGLGIFVVNEIGNFITHVILRNLRPEGSTQRAIPRGFLFELVTCPNYFCEICAWLGFSIMTQTLTSYLFTLVGAGQMFIWAKGKHSKLRKDFDGKDGREKYPSNRKILIPFVI